MGQKRKEVKSKRERGTRNQPVFGILCRDGRVWARIIDGVEKKDLQPLIENKVKKGTVVCSDTWRGYTGIATKGYLHRLVNHSEGEYVNKEGNHINGLVQRLPSGVDPTAEPVDLIFLKICFTIFLGK